MCFRPIKATCRFLVFVRCFVSLSFWYFNSSGGSHRIARVQLSRETQYFCSGATGELSRGCIGWHKRVGEGVALAGIAKQVRETHTIYMYTSTHKCWIPAIVSLISIELIVDPPLIYDSYIEFLCFYHSFSDLQVQLRRYYLIPFP